MTKENALTLTWIKVGAIAASDDAIVVFIWHYSYSLKNSPPDR